jgi:hypothetical protein
MLRAWVAILLLAAGLAGAPTKHPVVVELFTSEGCSSCPPADQLLVDLDKSQPVSGADILVLSEHVDYWNHIGWRDPFSSAQFSDRQSVYANHFHLDSVYTPQIVVDGAAEVLGSDKSAAIHAVSLAGRADKLDIKLTMLPGGSLQLTVAPSPQAAGAGVFLAIADNEDTTDVRAGENKGRRLHHVAVVRSLASLGKVNAQTGLTKELPAVKHPENSRFIAFVQEKNQGRIIGSAELMPSR